MLNEQKITYRMKNLMESGFFGNKTLLTEAFADNDKVRLFQAAYNYTYDKNLAVDGVKGGQTDAAIADVKKQLGKDKLDDAGAKDFYQKFLTKLDENKGSINVGQGGVNTNKILNQAIQALINLAGTPLGIDGVIGAKTIAAIKTATENSEVINAENITTITGKAVKNILQLGVEGIATVQGGEKDAAAEEGGTKSKYGTCLSGNCENGQGKLKNTKGNIYIGTFVDFYHTCNDLKNKIQFANGDSFVGNTLQGYPVNGTYTYKSGSVFKGTFHPNSYNEKYGFFKHRDGWDYNGDFDTNGKFSGRGTYINKNGGKWTGYWVDGKPMGTTFKQLDSGSSVGMTSPTTSSKETISKFNIDMKKLLGIIKDYQNKWGFFYKEGTTIKFYDSFDDKKIFTSSVTPEILKLQGGWWVYKDNKIEFKSKNTGKVDYIFTMS